MWSRPSLFVVWGFYYEFQFIPPSSKSKVMSVPFFYLCAKQSQICSSMVTIYNTTQSIIVSARATDLRHIFSTTKPISEKVKKSLLDLPIADPSFFMSNHVTFVLGLDVYAKVVTSQVQVHRECIFSFISFWMGAIGHLLYVTSL